MPQDSMAMNSEFAAILDVNMITVMKTKSGLNMFT